jgi:hypothetical protein
VGLDLPWCVDDLQALSAALPSRSRHNEKTGRRLGKTAAGLFSPEAIDQLSL